MSKVVVITGASAGIGAATAEHLARRGMSLGLVARRSDALNTIAARCGDNALAIAADVGDRANVKRAVADTLARFGRIDVWINNVGQGITRPPSQLTDEDVDEIMRVNVKSALYGMQIIAPHFLERGMGHIINVSSFLSRVPLATYRSAYNAAKAALNALTANVRMDLAAKNRNIHVTLVMPGLVSTDFARNALGGLPTVPRSTALPPSQTPEEVAAVIAGVIRNPVAEVYTNPHHSSVAQKYFADVGAFEREATNREAPVDGRDRR
jgi:short-subunit dehydrogenase